MWRITYRTTSRGNTSTQNGEWRKHSGWHSDGKGGGRGGGYGLKTKQGKEGRRRRKRGRNVEDVGSRMEEGGGKGRVR